jgi:hypothetical protein
MPFDFSKQSRKKSPGGAWIHQVWAICPYCKQGRWVGRSWAKTGKSLHDGTCLECSYKHDFIGGKWRNGVHITRDGYIVRHFDTFTDEEKKIINPMFNHGSDSKRLGHPPYVKEHRAVMALHIGRALMDEEIVHHIDGNKSNNKLENLKLLSKHNHHAGHGDNYYQELQEALIKIRFLEHKVTLLEACTST